MSLGSFFKKVVKAATPVVKAAAPIVVTAVILHQPIKAALVNAAKNAARDEVAKHLGAGNA